MPPVRVNYNNLIYNEFTYGKERRKKKEERRKKKKERRKKKEEREAKSVRFSDLTIWVMSGFW